MVRSCVNVTIVSLVALALFLGVAAAGVAASWTDLDGPTLDSYGLSLDQLSRVSDGFPGGRWEPWRLVTRAQFAKMADRAFGISPVVPSAGLFDPSAPVTREQAIAVIARQVAWQEGFDLAGMSNDEIEAALAGFSDAASVGSGLQAEMAFAVSQGLVRGSKTGALAPQAMLTRIAAASLLVRAMEHGSLILHQKDSGTSLSLQVGDGFSVVLKGNPTTGFTWVPVLSQADSAVLQQVGETDYAADSELIGAGGTFTFNFRATAAGDAQPRLVYMRPWESVPPAQTFTVTVHVTTPLLDGTKWRLEGWSISSLNPADFEITASFKDGYIGGKAAVNLYSGPYHAGADGRLSIGRLIRTLMAGGDPEMRAEGAYFALLDQVRRYKLDAAHLILMDGNGNELLIFKPAA